MEVATLREFDALCLPPVKDYTPTQIKRIRAANKASQGVFAIYLNTSPSTVQKWEQGKKKPNGPSKKLLSIVERKGLAALARISHSLVKIRIFSSQNVNEPGERPHRVLFA